MGFLANLFGGSKKTKGNTADVAKRFDLRGRTGQGSMSKVYQAYDRNTGRTVALKLLDKEKTKKFEERFKGLATKKPTEGQVCIALDHPNIVKTFEYGATTNGEPYLVMEWLDGNGLNYLIETRSPKLDGRRVDLVSQICDATEYLHKTGFIHRDLCPRNIMVTPEGQIKLIDFGLTVPNLPEFVAPGNRTGTTDYMAPEIIKRMATDLRVDSFALGATAFEVFTGQLPWERAASSDENLRRRLNTSARDPRALRPELDEKVAAVLTRAVERDRKERYQTIAALRDAFRKLENQGY